MDTSNPSRPKGSRAAEGQARSRKASTHLVSLALSKDAPPLVEIKGGETVITGPGRILSETWRSLGEGRPYLETDTFALGPRSLRGILRLKSGDPLALALPAAIRLFKLLAARAIANSVGKPGSAGKANNAEVTLRGAGAIWRRGYAEKPLATLKQVVEARKSLSVSARS